MIMDLTILIIGDTNNWFYSDLVLTLRGVPSIPIFILFFIFENSTFYEMWLLDAHFGRKAQ